MARTPSEGYHFHQCGLTYRGDCVDLTKGCGHIWGHFPTQEGESNYENHLCPKCGRKDAWYAKMSGVSDITCKELS